VPRDLILAARAKGALRLIDREIARHPVDADIQKRADRRPEDKGKGAEEDFVRRHEEEAANASPAPL